MTAPHDLDRQLQAFLTDGPTELPDPSFDEVRDRIEATHQRVVIGPWRVPTLNKLMPLGLAAAVVAVLFLGTQLLASAPDETGVAPSATPTVTPSPPPSGGVVGYQMDGADATTEVNVVAEGASVSGTAVTTFAGGTHTVGLECAAGSGDSWAVAGTVEQTTVKGERPGGWSAVLVKDGSPQQIGIWLSDSKVEGSDCADWLAAIDVGSLDPSNFALVESGALVPPPDLEP